VGRQGELVIAAGMRRLSGDAMSTIVFMNPVHKEELWKMYFSQFIKTNHFFMNKVHNYEKYWYIYFEKKTNKNKTTREQLWPVGRAFHAAQGGLDGGCVQAPSWSASAALTSHD
jgi:hypothetical protein